jgi:methyl acetate hydrolase
MAGEMKQAIDGILQRVTSGPAPIPGVAFVLTDRDGVVYEGAAGVRTLGQEAPMTTDTVCAIFSTTKAVVGTLCLQLAEEGLLDLDAPAKTYAPALGEVQVLEGFSADGSLQLRPPKRDITTRMLLLHTAGFAYDFFNETYNRLAEEHGQPSVLTATRASITTPLLFDPGERWEYGSNMDWAGQVAEGVTGQRLGEALQERLLGPLEMTSTAFLLTDEMRARMAMLHQREDDGSVKPLDLIHPQDPEVHMGGTALYSTAEDYAKFIRMWLNDGAGPNGRILAPETVEMATANGLGEMKIKMLPGVIKWLTNDAEFFPGMPKSWALTFMLNDEDAPTGLPAGSLTWAGLPNVYFWIDRKNGIGGYWLVQMFPFADPTGVGGFLDVQSAVYAALPAAATV